MENRSCTRRKKLKHRVCETDNYSCDELDMTTAQQESIFSPQTCQVRGDILEITNNQGGVGFVAVGRRMLDSHKPSSPSTYHRTAISQLEPKETLHLSKPMDTNFASETNQIYRPIRETNNAVHMRHFSEPMITSLTEIPGPVSVVKSSLTLPMNEAKSKHQNTASFGKKANNNTKKTRKSNRRQSEDLAEGCERNDFSANSRVDNHSVSTQSVVEPESAPSPQPNSTVARSVSFANAYPICKLCGQRHRLSENHEYDYVEDVDDDLQCDICLQPFVDPFDTKCGHTFCSICLKNYVRLKKMCPVDRKELNIVSSDCWQSSLVMRKLVDKLIVHCPNTSHCELTLPRCELAAHLKERCPGAILRCTFAMFGCSYKGPRKDEKQHAHVCNFQHFKGDPVDSIYPDCVKHTIELFRPEGIAELGLAIVGGNDTPIRNVIVQTVNPGSLVAEDGRIHPGDIIIEVNGEDLYNASHVEARTLLSRSSRLMRFVVLREKTPLDAGSEQEASISRRLAVSLLKPPSDQLGIKITGCEDGSPGIYILELVPGRVAHANGQLAVGDRILEIGHTDLWDGTPEKAARVIQNAGERVDIVVSRSLNDNHVTIMNPWAKVTTLPRGGDAEHSPSNQLSPSQKQSTSSLSLLETSPMNASYQEKVISLKKAANESLGIIVAGGMTGSRGDLPVFVQDIQPMGVLGRDKRLQRGDLLIEVNGVELNGLSHSQAIAVLKDTANHCKSVTLTAYELNYSGKEEDFALWEELSGVHHQRSRSSSSLKDCGWSTWTPSWKMWLAVPPRCRIPRDVVIKKGNRPGLGFSIVGGRNEKTGVDSSVFVKYVVPNSPASVQGNIRCGDEIFAINGSPASRMTHSSVLRILKRSTASVILSVISWPGSVH